MYMKRVILLRKYISLALVLCTLVLWAAPCAGATGYGSLLVKLGHKGDMVLLIQERLRDLGYYPYKITGQFGSVTHNAVTIFQQTNGLTLDGIVGGQTAEVLFSRDAKRLSSNNLRMPTPSPTPKPIQYTYGELLEWSVGKNYMSRGSKFRIRDFYTGLEYYAIMVGGYNHCDFEPATKEDCATLKKTYGGVWQWTRRPVLVRLNNRWYAGSINGMPHGYETIPNNGMDGQVCLHLLNSRTHGTNVVCSKHQNCIKIAAGKK